MQKGIKILPMLDAKEKNEAKECGEANEQLTPAAGENKKQSHHRRR
jgi:hypothetical protein